MARTADKRKAKHGAASTGGRPKRQRVDKDLLEDGGRDEFFVAEEPKEDASGSEPDAADEEAETAEEKRLRLAKAYLQQLRDHDGLDADDDGADEALAEHLREQAEEAAGRLHRQLADRLRLPDSAEGQAEPGTSGRFLRCHRQSVTGLALSADDRTAYSVAKDGSVFQLDVETLKRTRFGAGGTEAAAKGKDSAPVADWVRRLPRGQGSGSLVAVAVSDDGRMLAVGGGDRIVHLWDARSRQYIQGFPGHKDAVTGLAFREGTQQLFSASLDRTVKIWSLAERAYVDTLYGHQAGVLAVDVLRQERAVTAGHDHTCRVWKVAEESQLIFRAHAPALDAVTYVTGTEWLSGGADGSLALWSQMKKRPVHVVRGAHCPEPAADVPQGGAAADARAWVQSVAVCRGSDLAASGAGDGALRLWAVQGAAGKRGLRPLGALPAAGFVNGLALARSGRFALAGLGAEPRLGRWAVQPGVRSGLLLHALPTAEE